MRYFPVEERRRRLARRHGLAPGHGYADPVAAARAMTALHATEPATVHLSLQARVPGLQVADVERAMYDDRSIVKQLAMRRTLFAFPRDLLPAAWGSASRRVAGQEWRKTVRDLAASGEPDPEAWLRDAGEAVLAALVASGGMTAAEVRQSLPEVDRTVSVAPGTRWGGELPVVPRILTWLGARGSVVRGRSAGHWRQSRPRWEPMGAWLGEQPEPSDEADGYAELVRRWLWTFGPGTEDDLAWWLGATRTAVRGALATLDAVPVSLDAGATGYVLPGDDEPADPVEPWAALLPVLDPTVMGWKDRSFFLGDAAPELFDRNGNAGTTAWWDGRVVGCWVQDRDGRVVVVPLGDPGAAALAALAEEAERLSAWLDGVRVGTVYPSPLMRRAAG